MKKLWKDIKLFFWDLIPRFYWIQDGLFIKWLGYEYLIRL